MKTPIEMNFMGVATIIVFVVLCADLINAVGKVPEIHTEPHKWWEILVIGIFILCIFLLGKYSKFKIKDEL